MDAQDARLQTERIYTRLNARRPDIEKSENYYEGKQPLSFATKEWQEANAARYSGFSDNWCGTIVNAEAERLKPIGLTGVGDAGAKLLWDQLQYNEFDMQFSQGVITSLAARRVFVIVWGDRDGDAIVTFEHPSNVEIEYDWENPRLRKAALKTWVDESKEYATLYTPTELWKFERPRQSVKNDRDSQAQQSRTEYAADGGWQARIADGDNSWPLANPLGVVPVVELPNRPTLKGDPISEIQGVMPMQDAINLLWAYLFLAADYASMDARVILGVEPPKIPVLDATGKVIGTRNVEMKDLREKRLLTLTGENAKIDSWDSASLDIFTDTIEIAVGHIAAQTRTPPHYLVSNKGLSNLSGDALTAAEIGLVQKSNEYISFTDPQLREVLRLVALVKGEKALAQEVRLSTIVWKDREIRAESQLADALSKYKALGYPLKYILELHGKDPDTIKRVLDMRDEEERALMQFGVQDAIESEGQDVNAL
ncbi:SPP1 Gp6-like portal protein [Microterricola gilva]|uniref:SPP1 Gp6-like portal protein n=1 Tax=Microterricola gilva TaxID=393267 RepID=A0A4Q8AKJ9_9MICO|nr:phage portal protein [Microterricola gilva]RZU64928.1 SPP1 Gp6-like portal protein [Microterricola gilva]